MKPTPPALPGSPFIGHTMQFIKDRDGLLRRGFEKLGPIFSIKLFGKNSVVLIGPEYQQIFFSETDKKLSMHKTYKFLAAAFGEVGFTGPPEVYTAQRPILHSPFKAEKMITSIKVMQTEVQQWLDTLGEQGEIELTSAITTLVQNVASHALMGKEFREKAGSEFWGYYQILGQSLDPMLPPNLPLPKFIRRDQARKKLSAILRPIIATRRAHPEDYDDFLQDFVNSRYKDGSAVDDETILSLILGLMFAGHETTAGQAAWTIIQLLQNPDYLALVQQEIAEYLPVGQQIDGRGLSNLKHVFWAVEETTRLNPSADMLFRMAEEDVEVGEYRIPQGWSLMVNATIAQKLPDVFSNPESYDPLRFSPERKEDRAHRFSIIGFGGGIHKCAGMNFANNEMIMITSLLLQQFDLELVTKDPQINHGLGANRPKPTIVRYRRKTQSNPVPVSSSTDAAASCPHLSVPSTETPCGHVAQTEESASKATSGD
ncbi:MAG: cytochrome P450 [Ktedonobacteraceae bacterium]